MPPATECWDWETRWWCWNNNTKAKRVGGEKTTMLNEKFLTIHERGKQRQQWKLELQSKSILWDYTVGKFAFLSTFSFDNLQDFFFLANFRLFLFPFFLRAHNLAVYLRDGRHFKTFITWSRVIGGNTKIFTILNEYEVEHEKI